MRYLIVAILLVVIGFSSIAWAEGTSVAYVQATRLLSDSPQSQQMQQRVQEAYAGRQADLDELQAEIEQMELQLKQEGEAMDPEELRRLQNDIGARTMKFKHARDELAQDKQLSYADEEVRVTRIIREVIEQVAQDEKIDIVIQSGVLWYSPRVDITDKILQRLVEQAETD